MSEVAANSSGLRVVSDKINFAEQERQILQYWEEVKAFETSLKQSEGKKPYTFYDGPPFATGLPHYGHILAGTIKDVVTRYAHQTGHYVSRRFGWDCHGLPVEYEIDQKLGIKVGSFLSCYAIPPLSFSPFLFPFPFFFSPTPHRVAMM